MVLDIDTALTMKENRLSLAWLWEVLPWRASKASAAEYQAGQSDLKVGWSEEAYEPGNRLRAHLASDSVSSQGGLQGCWKVGARKAHPLGKHALSEGGDGNVPPRNRLRLRVVPRHQQGCSSNQWSLLREWARTHLSLLGGHFEPRAWVHRISWSCRADPPLPPIPGARQEFGIVPYGVCQKESS